MLGKTRSSFPDAERAAVLAKKFPPWRSRLLVALMGLCFTVLAGRAFFLATNPLIQIRANMLVVNAPQDALLDLVKQAERLSTLSRNLESISLGALRQELERSVSTAERAALQFSAQSRAWSELRGKIKQDSSTYDSLRQQLAELQRLQQGEIARLKEAIDAAQRPSIFADIWNLSLSFVLGILGSVLASGVYDNFWARKKDDSQKASTK